MQGEEPTAACGPTHGERQQADVRLGRRHRLKRLLSKAQATLACNCPIAMLQRLLPPGERVVPTLSGCSKCALGSPGSSYKAGLHGASVGIASFEPLVTAKALNELKAILVLAVKSQTTLGQLKGSRLIVRMHIQPCKARQIGGVELLTTGFQLSNQPTN